MIEGRVYSIEVEFIGSTRTGRVKIEGQLLKETPPELEAELDKVTNLGDQQSKRDMTQVSWIGVQMVDGRVIGR